MASMGGDPAASTSSAGEGPSPSGLSGVVVVIPAWQPEARLTALLHQLRELAVERIVLVDDGSGPGFAPLFAHLAQVPGVQIRHHARNLGKGRALKTAFRWVLETMPQARAVVTADADGQHLAEDIVRIARQLQGQPEAAVLGVRSFGKGVPWRSRLGNRLTRRLFALTSGSLLQDTQTGLRGLPKFLLQELEQLPGERYEYEMVMLAHLCRAAVPITQLPVQTVYLEGNRGSHFRPFHDSLLVFGALLSARRGATLRRPAPTEPHPYAV